MSNRDTEVSMYQHSLVCGLDPRKSDLCRVVSFKKQASFPPISTMRRVFQPKECYKNCALWVMAQPTNRFEVVLGMAASIIPIEHAWIFDQKTGLYFDPTWELHTSGLGNMYIGYHWMGRNELQEYLSENDDMPPTLFDLVTNEWESGFLVPNESRGYSPNFNMALATAFIMEASVSAGSPREILGSMDTWIEELSQVCASEDAPDSLLIST